MILPISASQVTRTTSKKILAPGLFLRNLTDCSW
jgi:hypothetical protein